MQRWLRKFSGRRHTFDNGLSDSAFALILPGGERDSEGKTTPRSLRKLPHHGADGALDPAHIRNGLSRAPQMTGVSDAQRSRAVTHLERHLAAMNKAAEHAPELLPGGPPPLALDFDDTRRYLEALGALERTAS